MPASKEGTTQYRDALYTKGSEVIPWVVETTGAVCPHGVDEIRRCSRRAATRDLTKYTDSWSARSFASHHRQRISSAVVSRSLIATTTSIPTSSQQAAQTLRD